MMRTQLRTSTEQRRRSSMCLAADSAPSLLDAARRRSSNVSMGNGQFLAVPDLKFRRSSLSTSTSALLGMAEGTRKRGSFTSGSGDTGSLLSVPGQDCEPRRRSLPGYMEVKSHSTDCLLDRRRTSVRPDEVYEQINNEGTRKMKIFGMVMMLFLAFVIGVSFFKLFHH